MQSIFMATKGGQQRMIRDQGSWALLWCCRLGIDEARRGVDDIENESVWQDLLSRYSERV